MCQVTQSHVGQIVRVSNGGGFTSLRLVALDLGNSKPYVCRNANGDGVSAYAQAIPPGYREVTTADFGRNVEVSANGREWKTRLLVGLDSANPRKYITRSSRGNGGWFWRHALVRVS